jgi:hypothetical protein
MENISGSDDEHLTKHFARRVRIPTKLESMEVMAAQNELARADTKDTESSMSGIGRAQAVQPIQIGSKKKSLVKEQADDSIEEQKKRPR